MVDAYAYRPPYPPAASAIAAREFDEAVADLAGRHGDTVALPVTATLVWGRPAAHQTGRIGSAALPG